MGIMSDTEEIPAKRQKTAGELLEEITGRDNAQNKQDNNNRGLDLHGKTIPELTEMFKIVGLSKNQQKKIKRYITYLEKAPERREKKREKQRKHPRKLKHKKIATRDNLETNYHLGLDLALD